MAQTPEEIVYAWWKNLNDARDKTPNVFTPFNSGDSANLRRAKTLEEVLINAPAMYELKNRLAAQTIWENLEKNWDRIALIAAVLSHVRTDKNVNLPLALAELTHKKDHSGSTIKLRFQRLIQNQTPEEIFRPMIRMLTYLDEKTDVHYLAKALYFWNDNIRKEWAIEFYKNVK